jgi:hypothetical protein
MRFLNNSLKKLGYRHSKSHSFLSLGEGVGIVEFDTSAEYKQLLPLMKKLIDELSLIRI